MGSTWLFHGGIVAELTQILSTLKTSLSITTGVEEWDYEGVAPDSAFPAVGSVWPYLVTPGTVGKKATVDILVVAALWASSPSELLTALSSFTNSILAAYGDNIPCDSQLGTVASSVGLGGLTIGAPSYSAASAAGNLRGTWASVEFTLTLRLK